MRKPWYLNAASVVRVVNKIAKRVSPDKLHVVTESICDEIWRKGELYCHRERTYVSGCTKPCSICRPNN